MSAIETTVDEGSDAASLTDAVLSEEAARLEAQEADQVQTVYADDALPGVGDEELTVREAMTIGGSGLLIVLSVLNAFDDLDVAAASLLAPDIQDTLGVSDAVIAVATSAGSLLLIVGGLVLGRIADRGNRAAHRRHRHDVLERHRLRHRVHRQRAAVLPRPQPHRLRQVQHLRGAGPDDRRRLPHRRAGASARGARGGGADGWPARTAGRRRHRGADRGRRRLALGLRPDRHPHLRDRRAHAAAVGSPAGPVRAAVDRGRGRRHRWRAHPSPSAPPTSASCRSGPTDRPCSRSSPSASRSSPSRSSPTSTSRTSST